MIRKILFFFRLTNENDLELKLYSFSILISCIVNFTSIIIFFSLNESNLSTKITLVVAEIFLFFFAYKLYIERSFHKYLTYSFIIILFFCIDGFYFVSEGIVGATGLTYTIFSVLSNFLVKEKNDKKYLILFILINFTVTFLISKIFPDLVLKYATESEKEFDFIFSSFTAIFFSGYLVKIFKDSYDLDRENLKSQKQELEKANKELDLARIEAEKLASVKSNFLSNMSHEIRTPLNGIIAMSELFPSYSTNYEKQKAIEIIQTSSKLLLSIVNDILDYSKIDSGQMTILEEKFSIQNLIQEIKDNFSFEKKILESKINFITEIDKRIKTFLIADSLRIKQVLLNLVSNSFKFTETGFIKLNLKLNYETESEQGIFFEVIDSGIGIKNKENLFQLFSQEDSSITRKYGGTGLGLAISKNLLNLMNSDLEFESEFQKGSKFYFYLKLKKEAEKIQIEIDHKSESSIKYNSILLVEDDKSNQTIFQMFMRKLKLNFDIAENGLIAVEKVKKKNYDFIFMDMNMPIMDGITATTNIREMKLISQPKIVALTANVLDEYKQKCLSSGMNDFLTKPYTLFDLTTVLSK